MKKGGEDVLKGGGFQGICLALAPAPLVLANLGLPEDRPAEWQWIVAGAAALLWLATGFTLFVRPRLGKAFGFLALAGSAGLLAPAAIGDPLLALLAAVSAVGIGFGLHESRSGQVVRPTASMSPLWSRQRAKRSLMAVLAMLVLTEYGGHAGHFVTNAALAASGIIAQLLTVEWAWRFGRARSRRWTWLRGSLALLFIALLGASLCWGGTWIAALLCSLASWALLSPTGLSLEKREHWWELLLDHPARFLVTTFLSLCVLGTLLLGIPAATSDRGIPLLDAAFTAVSSVCVTGLIVLDTPRDFTLLGQGFLLTLIQLGGLGIMGVTTVALHAMGRRISMRQERVLTNITATDHHHLIDALVIILKWTFLVEFIGAVVLSLLFHGAGDAPGMAAWRGMFTSVSAFCNAGFALQSDSLISFQDRPLILHAVSTLIVLGGLAPATALLAPRWLARKSVPVEVRISLSTTAALLAGGTLALLAFEWNGVLAGLGFWDKLHNAWFQSVTLRTAGFNSVDFGSLTSPSFLVMLAFMFIGGSPGGTAGGIKTSTFGILAMSFWATVSNRRSVVVHHRRIPPEIIFRATTTLCAGLLVWFLVVIMLEVTQTGSVRNLVFEATSALGTVGLSLGATAQLDGIGKVIIMAGMFVGRIGPITLFTLLSADEAPRDQSIPEAKIFLT